MLLLNNSAIALIFWAGGGGGGGGGHKKNEKCGKGPYIYDIHTEWRWEVLKVVMCLWILLFLNHKSKTPKRVIFYDVEISGI